jgi:hypothetical protein
MGFTLYDSSQDKLQMVAAVGSQLVCQLLFFTAFPIQRSAVVGAIDLYFLPGRGLMLASCFGPVCRFQNENYRWFVSSRCFLLVILRTVVLELHTYGERRRAKNQGNEL